MVAAPLRAKDKTLDEENTIKVDDRLRLLTSAAIYGANASGKSNLIQAVAFMRSFVLMSAERSRIISVDRFRLSTTTENQPALFEIVFIVEGVKYRYGFEVTTKEVVAEWLSYVPKSREVVLFDRKGTDIQFSNRSFKEGKLIKEKTRENALFLSVVAQFNGPISSKVSTWFEQLYVNLGVNDSSDLGTAVARFHAIAERESILKLVKGWDLGIEDLQPDQVPAPWASGEEENTILREAINMIFNAQQLKVPEDVPTIKTVHRKYNEDEGSSEPVLLDFLTQESAGTQRLFSLARPILDALSHGHVLVVDEIDARLHPIITCAIIRLFNSKETNPQNAQLIFTTHDTNLLRNDLFRRDQIWFVEKDKRGATDLYSLAEFKVRNDASFEENYLEGRYGAIPFIRSQPIVVMDSGSGPE